MAFTYNSVSIRPNENVPWFGTYNPTAQSTIVNAVKSAPGYIGGAWRQDPENPNQYLITHTWINKITWENMSASLKTLPEFQNLNEYNSNNNITRLIRFSEE